MILNEYIIKIYKLSQNAIKIKELTKKKSKKLLNPVKALTNCLMSQEICENLETRMFSKRLVDDFLGFLHHFHSFEINDLVKESKEAKKFFTDLQNECTLALCLIEKASETYISS